MLLSSLKNLNILSFSAHPDDEIGGAGGFLVQAKRAGARIKLVLCLDPGEERFGNSLEEERAVRLKEFNRVGKALHARTAYLGLPRYPVHDLPNVLALAKKIRSFRPDIVLTLSDEERHADHRAVAALARSALWQASRNAFPACGKPFRASLFMQYEGDNPMREPTLLRDISDAIKEKRKLLAQYASQVTRKDIVSTSEALNRFRGLMYKASDYAEAFKLSQFFYG